MDAAHFENNSCLWNIFGIKGIYYKFRSGKLRKNRLCLFKTVRTLLLSFLSSCFAKQSPANAKKIQILIVSLFTLTESLKLNTTDGLRKLNNFVGSFILISHSDILCLMASYYTPSQKFVQCTLKALYLALDLAGAAEG